MLDLFFTYKNPGSCPNCRSHGPHVEVDDYADDTVHVRTNTCVPCGTVWEEHYPVQPSHVVVTRKPRDEQETDTPDFPPISDSEFEEMLKDWRNPKGNYRLTKAEQEWVAGHSHLSTALHFTHNMDETGLYTGDFDALNEAMAYSDEIHDLYEIPGMDVTSRLFRLIEAHYHPCN